MRGLTELQSKVLEIINKHRSDNPITNRKITDLAKVIERDKRKEGADLRAVINALRQKGYPICGSDKGYFWASSEAELTKYINQLAGRISKIQEACDGLNSAYGNIGLKVDGDYVANYNPSSAIKTYKVFSKNEKGVFYIVSDFITGFQCTCPYFKFYGKCKHINEVTNKLAEKNQPLQISMFEERLMA